MNSELHSFLVWQLADSAFPTGGFAHSSGLEAAWQQGEIRSAVELRRFLWSSVQQAGYAMLPLVAAAHEAPERFAALDELSDAFLTNAVANRASRVQGRTLVATAARVWPCPALDRLQQQAARGCAHLAPAAGVTFRTLGVPLPTVQQLMLFGVARGIVSAAVRLGIIGSYEGQRLQSDCAPWLDEVIGSCAALRDDDITQTAPLLDVLQAGHDRLYSRLFQS